MSSIHFHPISSLACVTISGEDRVLFFALDNIRNSLTHQVQISGSLAPKAAFTADGKHVFITNNSRFIYLYNLIEDRMEKIQNIPECNETSWNKFQCSPCGKVAVFVGASGKLMVLSLPTKRCLKLMQMNSYATCITISEDGSLLIAAGQDQHIYLWSLSSFECIGKYSINSGSKICSVALSADMKHLSVG